MSSKQLLILFVVLTLLGGAAYLTRDRGVTPRGHDAPAIGDAVVPGLDVNQVQSIVITSPEGSNRLARIEGTWVVGSRYNHPADFARIREQLTGLREVKIGQIMRADDTTRSETGLDEAATMVTLHGAGDTVLATLQVGSPRSRQSASGGYGGYPDGQYLAVGDDHIAVVSGSLNGFSATPTDWIERQLLQLDANEIATIAVRNGSDDYVIQNDTNQVMTLQDLAEDETFEAGPAGQLKRALAYLSCDDVADPALTDEAMGFDAPSTYSATLRDGRVYTATLGAATNNLRHARFTITGDEEHAHLQDWTYLLPTYAADAMTTARDTLVKKVENEPDEPALEASAPGAATGEEAAEADVPPPEA